MHGNLKPAFAHRAVASVFGVGFLPLAPGTWASLIAAAAWYFLQPYFAPWPWLPWLLAGLSVLAGSISVAVVSHAWGDDPSEIVVDEWAGTWIACLLLPHHPAAIAAAFLLFRFFDIVKPLGIRRLEQLHGSAGVMLDDLVAGLYANILVQLLVFLNLFR
jgi:phosphatidylglycerophosphatase A